MSQLLVYGAYGYSGRPITEAAATRDAELRSAGITAMCGVGMEVVHPGDSGFE